VAISGTSIIGFRLSSHPCVPLVQWLKRHCLSARCRIGQNRGAGPPFGAGRFATATGLVGDTGPGTGLVGVAVANAGADDATARVRLNGTSVVGAAA
jgi:hypothetical protein